MAKHQADLVRCSRQPGAAVGRVCAAHDGRCVACDSMVRPVAPARVCDGCNGGGARGSRSERCLVCGAGAGEGGAAAAAAVADAYYCKSCVQMEKDRDGCPAVVNAGTARRDAAFIFFSVRSSNRGGFRATMA
uniref:PHF5-like protein n=1 Tax=Oryza meridionalis TaxID=40149 RepID=A0A0E0F5Y9_9ORYZ